MCRPGFVQRSTKPYFAREVRGKFVGLTSRYNRPKVRRAAQDWESVITTAVEVAKDGYVTQRPEKLSELLVITEVSGLLTAVLAAVGLSSTMDWKIVPRRAVAPFVLDAESLQLGICCALLQAMVSVVLGLPLPLGFESDALIETFRQGVLMDAAMAGWKLPAFIAAAACWEEVVFRLALPAMVAGVTRPYFPEMPAVKIVGLELSVSEWFGVAVSLLLFASIHVGALSQLFTFGFGAFYSWVFFGPAQRNLAPCLVGHFLGDITSATINRIVLQFQLYPEWLVGFLPEV